MRHIATLFLALLPLLCAGQDITAQMPDSIAPIRAPFAMAQLERPTFPSRKAVLRRDGGLQRLIDATARRGGGTVTVPRGVWHTGRVTLRSNICLNLEEGAELHFSGQASDYRPVVRCRNEGVDILGPGAMIYADSCENIAMTGRGKLVAPPRDCELLALTMAGIPDAVQQLPFAERVFDGTRSPSALNVPEKEGRTGKNDNGLYYGTLCMPVFFGPVGCKNVLVEGVTFEGAIFWNIVPVYCENIIIRGVTVSSAGIARTDGIDIDSSRNVLIEYTSLDCGDDCFTLKAGRGMDGLLRNRPTENVVIRHCVAHRGAGGLTIGSETAAMIRNVYMHDVTIEQPKYAIYFKTRRPRGGGGECLHFERIHIVAPKTRAIYWDMLGSATYVGRLAERFNTDNDPRLTPRFRDIHFTDVTIDTCPDFIKAIGLPESPIDGVSFLRVTSPKCSRVTLQDVGRVTFE